MTVEVPPRRRRHVLRWVLVALVAVIVLAAAAFTLSPKPGALVIRAVFQRGADQQTEALAVDAPVTDLVADIAYRTDDPDAYLDVYTPTETTGQLPTIVWTHGGAWISGNRTNYAGYYRRLADAGFTVVSLGYSLAPGHRYPTAVRQLDDAHAYLLAHAEELHIDPSRIVLAGDSAGAQLSSQLAAAVASPDYAAQLGFEPALPPESLRGVVLDCGIYDISAIGGGSGILGWGVQQALWAYTGERNFEESEAARQMSSLFVVTEDFPPAFVSGGNADPLTEKQSKPLAARLTGLGVAVDEMFFPDDHEPALGHEYQFDLSLADAREALQRTIDFVRKVTA